MSKNIPELFGSLVFSDSVMQARLSKDTYKALKKTIAQGKQLEQDIADEVAAAMKNWAVEHGATHYTHWFQPLTGITAEKHDSFISPAPGGKIIMQFSGKSLIKGEPDASSFPSGGIRATFEARGYTAWDPTAYAFIKNGALCIPTAFCSYGGEALDKKTPLLRSIQALDKQALRILKLFGKQAKQVISTVGAEQEYFLIDKQAYLKRADLVYTGRTLFGSRPPKGQELDDHYFGAIKPRVSAFMKELDEELWKLGILAKTKHNETAPAQHELAPIYSSANTATDHNQLTMELMKSIANKHDLACLLHEKPFAGINGSAKHTNWSLSTDSGENLFDPGKAPHDNTQFLLFLAAVIKSIDKYQDLLRISAASAGNDHRLGGYEAPPAIISVFLGDELTRILEAAENGLEYTGIETSNMQTGADVLPNFSKDSSDRNRTSPFAFTGNKFEFRMPGSSLSVADPSIVLNTAVADALCEFADILEKSKDLESDLKLIIRDVIKSHKRIIFNGNNYSSEWVREAENRGLLNLESTVKALPRLMDAKNAALFEKHGIFTEKELESRYEILLENYCKTINIEALTIIDIAKQIIIPSSISYQTELADIMLKKRSLEISSPVESKLLDKLNLLTDLIYNKIEQIEQALEQPAQSEMLKHAEHYQIISGMMQELRVSIDALESCTSAKHRGYPAYAELLYSVN